MKKFILIYLLAGIMVPAVAAPAADSSAAVVSQLVQVNTSLLQVQETLLKSQQVRDAKAFCYHEDKAYSEGGKLNGMTCHRKGSADVFERNTMPLYWETNVRTTNQ